MRPHRRSLPVRLLDHVADLGDQPPMRILCGAVIAAGLVGGDRKLAGDRPQDARRAYARDVRQGFRQAPHRPHPAALDGQEGQGRIRSRPGRSNAKEETSFPSGHSAGAAAVARAFARAYPEQAAPAYAAGGIIALAQIPRCAHYPSDVGAGLAIGVAAEALTEAAFDLLAPPSRHPGAGRDLGETRREIWS